MSRSDADRDLRGAVVDGIAVLRRKGVTQATVARTAGCSESNVSKWIRGTLAPKPEHAQRLAVKWPAVFDADLLADLIYTSAVPDLAEDRLRTVGTRVLTTTRDVYAHAVESITAEPVAPTDRVIRHVGLHLDRRDGTDPAESDPLLDEETAELTRSFVAALQRRAREGWQIRQVVSASMPSRVEVLEARIRGLEGADVRVRGYLSPMPLVINALVVANRDVLLAVDHLRWERPGSALLLRSRDVVSWATGYFDDLFESAPYELRTPAGPSADGFRAFREDCDPTR